MDLVITGLIIISIAWLIQLIFLMKGKKELSSWFVACYALGVLVLVINEYKSGSGTIYYESAAFILSLLVLIKSIYHKKKK
jgi:hypothetical protein